MTHTWRWVFAILPIASHHGRYAALPLPAYRRCRVCGACDLGVSNG